ncbi:MAG: hypothetical protein N2446_01295 [Elusimicrobiales bacterium]|nr:hypothetical protein [Elusimicrobiales bacterium]
MKKFIYLLEILLMISCLLVFFSCKYVKKSEQKKLIILLVDISSSVRDNLRNQYIKEFKEIVIPFIKDGDRLIIQKIVDNPDVKPTIIFNETFPVYSILMNRIEYETQKIEFISKSTSTFHSSLITGERVKYTGILDSLNMTEEILKQYQMEKFSRVVLIIFSDMIEDSNYYNFETGKIDNIDNLIKEIFLKYTKRRKSVKLSDFPQLDNLEVYISGIYGGANFTPQRIDFIKRFWMEYFKSTGAMLKSCKPQLIGLR